MAVQEAYSTHGVDVSQTITVEMPFADSSQWGADDDKKTYEEENLPPELRSGGPSQEEFDSYWDQFVKPEGVNA